MQYYIEDHHPAIIPREIFLKVQEVLQIADMLKNHPMKFDDKMLRKLLKRVEVLSTEEILITFAGGLQMREKMQDTLKRMPIRYA